jgi:hypothetical protein
LEPVRRRLGEKVTPAVVVEQDDGVHVARGAGPSDVCYGKTTDYDGRDGFAA